MRRAAVVLALACGAAACSERAAAPVAADSGTVATASVSALAPWIPFDPAFKGCQGG